MALQPTRPIGSTQVLVFDGAIITDAAALAVYPKDNGEVPAGSPLNVPVGVRFALGDVSVPATPTQTLPGFVFDDGQLAAISPHAPTTGAIANVLNATDQDITLRTWAANTYITVEPKDAASAAILTGIDLGGVRVILDNAPGAAATTGLGLGTGLPVVVIPMILTALPTAQAPLNVTIIIEVRHTASR